MSSPILKGVAFHNASVPTELRKHIEEAVGRRELDFVVSTTTLAEGADLPFRVTLVESWIVGFGADEIASLSIAQGCARWKKRRLSCL